MRKIERRFLEIWEMAEEANKRSKRFEKIYSRNSNNKYLALGIYDTKDKKYVIFDTINLAGNFRYNPAVIPPELIAMEKMIKAA